MAFTSANAKAKTNPGCDHFLDVLILRAADLFPDQARVTGLCIAPEGKLRSRNIHLPSRQQAQDYLANLVQEMNTESAAVLMPVESVLELEKENLTAAAYNPRFVGVDGQ